MLPGKQRTQKKIEIGSRIRMLRTKMKLSMDELAARIDSTSGTISNIENGFSMPSGETLLRLSETFQLSVDWIMHGHMPEQVHDSKSESIFFNDKWHFFCHFRDVYMSSEESQRFDALCKLVPIAASLSNEQLQLLLAIAKQFQAKP